MNGNNCNDSDLLITSTQNPRIKQLLALQQKSQERRRTGLFVVEGWRELEHGLAAGYEVVCVYLEQRGESSRDKETVPCALDKVPCIHVSPNVYERIAYRGSTEGVVAVMRERKTTLETLVLGENPLLVVLESVEKPGNLGAVLRSADAAAATAVIVCDPLTDAYNPNLIRASIGACFTVPMVACTSEECIAFLKKHRIQILTAQLQDSSTYFDTPMDGPTAIVLGTESTGLTQIWRNAADAHIRIPMLGHLDSLNVSVSAAILLYEAVRQRHSKLTR